MVQAGQHDWALRDLQARPPQQRLADLQVQVRVVLRVRHEERAVGVDVRPVLAQRDRAAGRQERFDARVEIPLLGHQRRGAQEERPRVLPDAAQGVVQVPGGVEQRLGLHDVRLGDGRAEPRDLDLQVAHQRPPEASLQGDGDAVGVARDRVHEPRGRPGRFLGFAGGGRAASVLVGRPGARQTRGASRPRRRPAGSRSGRAGSAPAGRGPRSGTPPGPTCRPPAASCRRRPRSRPPGRTPAAGGQARRDWPVCCKPWGFSLSVSARPRAPERPAPDRSHPITIPRLKSIGARGEEEGGRPADRPTSPRTAPTPGGRRRPRGRAAGPAR